MVKALVCGAELPRYITHTNLVLIPKNVALNTFSDLRPISLSNFLDNWLNIRSCGSQGKVHQLYGMTIEQEWEIFTLSQRILPRKENGMRKY
ncbi:hypothetical protein H5410_050430 [Solanum commersonii]|uniref:Uncharacterized protein n=1 Tax=Solanum commersonii TaxID=4109 RepID=A0A9J5WVF7_SOLCO|nr:hypothetical protein H5410_050430 [Solanum commersonii]